MKKFGVCFSAALLALVCLTGGARAAEPVTVLCGGFPLEIGAEAENGVTMAPLSAFCDEVGAKARVDTDILSEEVLIVTMGSKGMILEVGSKTLLTSKPGEEISLPCPVERRGTTVYVPLRAVAEALDIVVGWDGEAGAVTLELPRKQVEVSTVEELIAAVEPNTEILLAAGVYDFSSLEQGQAWTNYVAAPDTWMSEGLEIVVKYVDNLTIRGGEGVSLVTPYPYADVLQFQNCSHIRVEGVFARHDVAPGRCLGDVLEFDDCKYVAVADCVLDGSGTYGVNTYHTDWLRVEDCVVSNCSYGAFDLSGRHIAVTGTLVEDCREFWLVGLGGCRDVLFEDCTFQNNEVMGLVNCTDSLDTLFRNCRFSNNVTETGIYMDWGNGGVFFEDCAGLEDANGLMTGNLERPL